MNLGQKIRTIADILRHAERAAIDADPGADHDGGTCNLDSPAFRVAHMQETHILAAARQAGVKVDSFTWLQKKRWYWLRIPVRGQANRRSTMVEAAQKVLDAPNEIPGWESCAWLQMD